MGNEQRKETLRAVADDFWDMILLNILFVFSCFPIITYGAAVSALYFSVSHLEEKRRYGGAIAMYWAQLKQSFGKASPLWCAILAMGILIFVNLAILGQTPPVIRYCSYGLQIFVLLLLQVVATVGFPIISENKTPAIDAVKKSFEVLGRLPARTLLSCLIRAIPFAMIPLAPKAFAGLFLLWIVVYFSFAERLIAAMIGRAIQQALS